VLLAAAGWLFCANRGAEDAAPGDAASAANFVCEGCGEFFALTPRQLEEAERGGRAGPSGKGLAFPCPKCGQARGVRAEKCPQHGEVVKLNPGPQDRVKCSKCEFRGF
jgi:predicted RNA-binding Zn-ribbon protein involved in translation (DUF1610 family)